MNLALGLCAVPFVVAAGVILAHLMRVTLKPEVN